MTCAEAQQVAIAAVQRLGYRVQDASSPQPGVPGVVVAEKQTSSRTARVLVQVFCTALGAEVAARAEGEGLGNLNFAGEFQKAFAAAVSAPPTPRALATTGVDVAIVLERPANNGLRIDFSNAGIVPVRVHIANYTPRRYRLLGEHIVLQTASGERVQPLPLSRVLAEVPEPVRESVASQLLQGGTIAPRSEMHGYLFYPFRSYVRARVIVEDVDSEETEGFTIEF